MVWKTIFIALLVSDQQFLFQIYKKHFEWQEGYGAFSIGVGDVERTVNYINNQAEHHGKMDFKTEFRAFLKKHGIEWFFAPESDVKARYQTPGPTR